MYSNNSNKTVKVYGYNSNKAVMILHIYLCLFCLPEVDLVEGQSDSRLPYFHPLHKILGYFLTYIFTNSIN